MTFTTFKCAQADQPAATTNTPKHVDHLISDTDIYFLGPHYNGHGLELDLLQKPLLFPPILWLFSERM